MSSETIPPLPDLSGEGKEPEETVYPNRNPWARVTQIPNPQKEIPDIDHIRPVIQQEEFQTVASRYEGLLSQDKTGRTLNEAQFAQSELFIVSERLPFTLDNAGVSAVPDTGKIEKGDS